jgi:hypothetical protein
VSTPTTGAPGTIVITSAPTVSPALDVSGYVELLLSDADTNTLVSRAIANAQAGDWPDWVPREGQQELVLLELMAQMVAELGYSLNQLPGYDAEVLLRLFGLSRDPGRPAITSVRFTVAASPAPVTIPAGTLVVLAPGFGLDPVTFATDVDLVVATGATTGTVAATAQGPGSGVNGVAAGNTLTVLSAVPYLDSAATAAVITSGTDPEDAQAFLRRGAPRFSRLTDTLTKPEHFTAAALETPGVKRAATYDLTTPGSPVGSTPGHVTIAVAGANGAPLASADRDALQADLQASAYVLSTVHAVDATVSALDVAATVTALPGYPAATVQANVTTALDSYLSPDAWAFGASVYRNELIALVDGVIGVDRVVSVTISGAGAGGDYALTGLGPLANLGTATITVASS